MKGLLCQHMKDCYKRGWISPRDGNISYRGANQEYYYITPSFINKAKIEEDNVLKMRLNDDKIIENKSNLKPSGELTLHTLILKDNMYLDKDTCVVHCHPPHILAFIGLIKINKELCEIKKYFPEISENIKIGKNVGHITARTDKLGITTHDNLRGNTIVALKQHGVVAVGEDFSDVMETIETLEYYCRIYLLSKET